MASKPKRKFKEIKDPGDGVPVEIKPSGAIAPLQDNAVGGDALAELKKLEGESARKAPASEAKPGESAPGSDSSKPKRRKFKRPAPENTMRLTIRQYWRLRDWMARRQLGLPEEYAGVFIQRQDVLVEPLVEPLVACLDEYLPDEWVVFLEEKSPLLMLFLALFEAESTFAATVNEAKKEIIAKQKPTQAPGPSAPAAPAASFGYPKKDEVTK